ncbi:DNA cytosine methyltransferase [Rhizobium mongolense]|uniref:DNA cytosine methyltransferase n=1 Tax=Rhizobium mongolense TaxID=57676 RepID=UPI0034A19D8D
MKDYSDEARKALFDENKTFHESMSYSVKHVLSQFNSSEKIGVQEELSITFFLRDCGIADDDIPAYKQFKETIKACREQLIESKINFELAKALVQASDTTRQHVLRRLEAGSRISASDVARIDKREHHFGLSDDDFDKAAVGGFLRKHLQKQAQSREEQFQEKVTDLFQRMMRHRFGKKERLADRNAIIVLAKELLSEFKEVFGSDYPERKYWLLAGLKDPEKQYLAELQYSLMQLAGGCFYASFPMLSTRYHQWSAIGTIFKMTNDKAKSDTTRRRYAPRQTMMLSAIDLCAGVGGQALGLEAAGFSLKALIDNDRDAIKVLNRNRPDWNSVQLNLEDWRKSAVFKTWIANSPTIKLDLIAGDLPRFPFTKHNKGKGQLLTTAMEIVDALKPRAFFFHTHEEFDIRTFVHYRNGLMEAGVKNGYHVEILPVKGEVFGLPQKSRSVVVIGIEQDSWEKFDTIAPPTPLAVDLRAALEVMAFPDKKADLLTPEEEIIDGRDSNPKQNFYDKWVATWRQKRKGTLAPDIRTLIAPNVSSGPWIEVGLAHVIAKTLPSLSSPPANIASNLQPTLSVLAQLQSLPLNWSFEGNEKQQKHQICEATPPNIAFFIGRAIHAALSGETVDADPSELIDPAPKPRRPAFVLSPQDSYDPRWYIARDWFNEFDHLDRDFDDDDYEDEDERT